MDAFLDRHRAALLDKHRWALTQSAKCQPKPAAPAGSEQKGQWVSFRVADQPETPDSTFDLSG